MGLQNKRYRTLVAHGTVEQPTTLLEAVALLLPETSRTTHKQLLRNKCVKINGNVITLHNTPIEQGSRIEIYNVGFAPTLSTPELKVIWQDEDLLLIYKEASLPTIASKPGEKRTLFRIVADHYKKGDAREKIFLLNRLDRNTRGFILFARNRETQQLILDQWERYILEQEFTALVEGDIPTPQGTLITQSQTKSNKEEKKDKSTPVSRRSKASYTVIARGAWRTLLQITLHGRYNGIRSQLQEMGYPLMGENKSLLKRASQLALSQSVIVFRHPHTAEVHRFTEPIPPFFEKLLHARITKSERAAIEARQSQDTQTLSLQTLKKKA